MCTFGHLHQCLDILRKAAPPETYSRVEELRINPLVIPHTLDDLFDIGTEILTDEGYLVNKRYVGGKNCVRGILDHLRGAYISHHDWRAERLVQLSHLLGSPAIIRAKHHAVWVEEVVHSLAFPQKLRVRDHRHPKVWCALFPNLLAHHIAGADRHRALINYHQGLFGSPRRMLTYATGGAFNIAQI